MKLFISLFFLLSAALFGEEVIVTTLAGSGSVGSVDDIGTKASFNSPRGIAVDSSGNVYVADSGNNRIRKITPAGVVTTIAGNGSAGSLNATGLSAYFSLPTGIAVDSSGNLYVADTNNHLIRKVTSAGVVTTYAGSSAGSVDGNSSTAQFFSPNGVSVDSSGNIVVADSGNNKIRKIDTTQTTTTIAGTGTASSTDGIGSQVSFYTPNGVALDSSGNIYVADYASSKIRKINASTYATTTIAGSSSVGYADGLALLSKLNSPRSVAVDSSGNIFIADSSNNVIRKLTQTGAIYTYAGTSTAGLADGPGISAMFANPYAIAIDSNGTIYVADTGNNVIRKITFYKPNPTPVLAIQSDKNSSTLGDTFNFAASATIGSGAILSYSWDFGDGVKSNIQNPSHAYYATGSFTVTCTALSANGIIVTKTSQVTVSKPRYAPAISLYADKTAGVAPLPVNFVVAASDFDGNISSIKWKVGGVDIGLSDPNISYIFSTIGAFDVACIVTDSSGLVTTKTATVLVNPGKAPPALSISADKSLATTPTTISFKAIATTSTGSISGYNWQISEGNFSTTVQNFYYSFVKAGVYDVNCTVTNSDGLSASQALKVAVIDPKSPPGLAISANMAAGSAPLTVKFISIVSDTATGQQYLWDFKDGSISADASPTHVFSKAGTYAVTCSVTDAYGNKTTQTVTIAVTVGSATLKVKSGWNLLSLPVDTTLSDYSIFGNGARVYTYSNGDGNYTKNPAKVVKAQGFWLNAPVDKESSFTGSAYTPDLSSLPKGWSLLGTGSVLSNIQSANNFKSVFTYNPTTGDWNLNPSAIYPGDGFWVNK